MSGRIRPKTWPRRRACSTPPEVDQQTPAHSKKIDRSSDDWVTRKVTAVGVITVAHQQISVGKQRAGRIVDVHIGPDLLHIWDGNDLLKTALRHGTKVVRKKNAAS